MDMMSVRSPLHSNGSSSGHTVSPSGSPPSSSAGYNHSGNSTALVPYAAASNIVGAMAFGHTFGPGGSYGPGKIIYDQINHILLLGIFIPLFDYYYYFNASYVSGVLFSFYFSRIDRYPFP